MKKIPIVKPIIKWAGGKRRLATRIIGLFPERWQRYHEPFLGGGAVFLELARREQAAGRVMSAHLADVNSDLIEAYRTIAVWPDAVVARLRALFEDVSPRAFFCARDHWNVLGAAHRWGDPETSIDSAALFVYLNRVGFNGLWRVNRAGKYNVPYGRHASPPTFDEVNLYAAARMFGRVDLRAAEFDASLLAVEPGDVVYLDPPYVPTSTTASFTSYDRDGFDELDQRALGELALEAAMRGATTIASNSDTPLVREIYAEADGWEVIPVENSRAIAAAKGSRGKVGELLLVHRGRR